MALPIGRVRKVPFNSWPIDSMTRYLNVLGGDSEAMELLGHAAMFSKCVCHVFIDLYFAAYFRICLQRLYSRRRFAVR